MKETWTTRIFALILALGAEVAHLKYGDHYAVLGLALAAIFISGLGVYKHGLQSLARFDLNMNSLMSVAVTGAMLIKQWPEAAMVMSLFSIAEAIEDLTLERARRSIESLLSLAPETATVRQPDGQWLEIAAREVEAGAVVRVRPGERVALDGEIALGASALNQAPITGESLPVEKAVGDAVFAGSINESGSFEYRVTAPFHNSTLSRIIRAVEEAQASRAPFQRFVDKFAAIYTPVIFALALLVGIVPPLFMGGEWLAWAYKALVILVIGCPCALVISTPVTIVSGLTAATKRGLLVKGGAFLEAGRKLNCLAFDKTGTLTTGRPSQTDVVQWQGDLNEARALAAALAKRSDHPVSRAVYAAAERDTVTRDYEVEGFSAVPGRGTRGQIAGRAVMLGNREMLREAGHLSPDLETVINALEAQGKSVVALCGPEGAAALFAVADTVRDSSRRAVAELKKLGLSTVMLSGDNQTVAEAVGASVGIDEVRGSLLPAGKLREIERLKKSGLTVGMVGDGINDAPALASAGIGFAMGAAGTDTAIETADVAVMDDDPSKIAAFIKLSRATHSILCQNITLAIGIKTAFFALTLMGHGTMWMAVFADIGVSLMVVFNGLRMLRK